MNYYYRYQKALAANATAGGIGIAAGLVTAMVGCGGGLLMIPALTTIPILRLSQHAAHGTSLAAIAVTGLTGAYGYREYLMFPETNDNNSVGGGDSTASMNTEALYTSLILAVTGMLGARVGARHSTKWTAAALQKALGRLMLVLAVVVPLKDAMTEHLLADRRIMTETNNNGKANGHGDDKTQQEQQAALYQFLPFAAVGGASGYLAGMFGVGGGLLVVPALTIFSNSTGAQTTTKTGTNTGHHQILATSLLATSLPAVAGTFMHARMGHVAWRVAPALCLGATLGATAGAHLGQATDETTLRAGFAGLLLVLGMKTLLHV